MVVLIECMGYKTVTMIQKYPGRTVTDYSEYGTLCS